MDTVHLFVTKKTQKIREDDDVMFNISYNSGALAFYI